MNTLQLHEVTALLPFNSLLSIQKKETDHKFSLISIIIRWLFWEKNDWDSLFETLHI